MAMPISNFAGGFGGDCDHRCKKDDDFWVENLTIEAMENFILKKYSRKCKVTLLNHSDILIQFKQNRINFGERDMFPSDEKIVENICAYFHYEVVKVIIGCERNPEEIIHCKFHAFKLRCKNVQRFVGYIYKYVKCY